MAENEMVKVHVDDGTKRGYDLKYTRKDAERYMAYMPNAKIVEDDDNKPAEDDEAEMKMMAPAEDKAMRAPRRSRAAADEKPAADDGEKPAEAKTEDK